MNIGSLALILLTVAAGCLGWVAGCYATLLGDWDTGAKCPECEESNIREYVVNGVNETFCPNCNAAWVAVTTDK